MTEPPLAEGTPPVAPVPPAAAVPPPGEAPEHAPENHDADEDLWPQLLDYIRQGTVIPVIGRDLLTLDLPVEGRAEPQRVMLYSALASALARELGVDVDPEAFTGPNPLGVVASAHIVRGQPLSRIYSAVPRVLQQVLPQDAPLPEALVKLAQIAPFKVFVTTTFDRLLIDCLKRVRQELPRELDYTPVQDNEELLKFRVGTRRQETLRMMRDMPGSTVVQILGKLSSTPTYVVTEEDAFEFVYTMQETRPDGFFELLRQMRLLIIGCRFPSWLVRFFLRVSRGKRLLQTDFDRSDFVVDPTAVEDPSLVQFLRTFRTQTEIFTTYGPLSFVDELFLRWQNRADSESDATTQEMIRWSVFISYASEDAAAASEIADRLRRTGLPVWLDRDRLGSGDDWARKIERNIKAASAFVPILSRNTLVESSREFRREWRAASNHRMGLPENHRFIFPLVIDDVPRGSEAIDGWMRDSTGSRFSKIVTWPRASSIA
jgi:hypothetical protein